MLPTATPIEDLEKLLSQPPRKPNVPTHASSRAVTNNSPLVALKLVPDPMDTSEIRLANGAEAESSGPSSIEASSSSSSGIASSLLSRVCATCHRQVSKYTCPRCNVATCSLPCYKSHSASCTRSFTAASLQEEQAIDHALKAGLGRTRAVLGKEYAESKAQKKHTSEMLQRLGEFNAANDAAASGLLSTGGVTDTDMNDAVDEEDLSPEEQEKQSRLLAALSLIEKLENSSGGSFAASSSISNSDLVALQSLLPPDVLKDFHRSLADGRMSRWIGEWKPWWSPDVGLEEEENAESQSGPVPASSGQRKPTDLTPDTWCIPAVRMIEEELPASAPPMPNGLPSFSSLFTGTPSVLLPLHIIEVVFSYVYALRLHNGEDLQSREIVAFMCELSPVLRGEAVVSSSSANSSTASSSIPVSSSSPSFSPTPALSHSLDEVLSSLLAACDSSSSPSSCCWTIARISDSCQIMREKPFVQRALYHVHSLVQRTSMEQKQSKEKIQGTSSASSSSNLPLSAMSRKLIFLESFVSDVWKETEISEWNRLLYGHWRERWTRHTEIHQERDELERKAKSQTRTEGKMKINQ